MFQIKVVEHWIRYKKVSGYKCLSPPRVELAIFWSIIMFKNEEVDSLRDWTLLKIRIISKNASNKSCWTLNSVQKSQWVQMSISSQSGACHLLKYYNVQKWGSRFTSGLDAAKNTHYIRKCFKWRKSHSWGLLMFTYVYSRTVCKSLSGQLF